MLLFTGGSVASWRLYALLGHQNRLFIHQREKEREEKNNLSVILHTRVTITMHTYVLKVFS